MNPDSAGHGPIASLGVFVALIALQRLAELALSARNARALRARDAVEHGRRHFQALAGLHVFFPLSLIAEVWLLGARPGSFWPLWLALWLAAQALRYAAIRALGERWNVRVWVIPGAPLVRSGPYRFLRHPNYVAVAVELIAGSMLFGAWRTALAASLWNAIALSVRIRTEERALATTAASPAAAAHSRSPTPS